MKVYELQLGMIFIFLMFISMLTALGNVLATQYSLHFDKHQKN